MGAVLGPRNSGGGLAMSNTDTSELLRLCDEILHARTLYQTNPEAWCQSETIARALKSRLQAEAPEDAEVAEIEKRHADCEAFYSSHGPFRPTWQFDRAILLAKLRTSQAEAQAPTTAASVLTEDEREQLIPLARIADWGGLRDHNSDNLSAEVTVSYPNGIQRTPLSARTFRALSELFDRLTSTVGAPAPASTKKQIAALLADFRGWNFEKLDMWSDDRYGQKHYLKQADAILALFARGDTP